MRQLLRLFGFGGASVGGDMFGRALSPLIKAAPTPVPADWLAERLLPWDATTGTRVGSVVPVGFEAYARVLHPAYGTAPHFAPISWTAAAEIAGCVLHAETQWESIEEALSRRQRQATWSEAPRRGLCPPEVLRPLSDKLVEHTTSPDVVWYSMWIGFPDVLAVVKGAPRFELPGREYALLSGPLSAAADVITSPHGDLATQSLWWPADRAWCVATEVDFRWTYVAGSERCIARLEQASGLEVLRTTPEHRGDIESDWPPPDHNAE